MNPISLKSIKTPKQELGFKPRILVFGVGGAGGNAVNNMIRAELEGVEFFAINTDAQSLEYSLAERKIQIGKELTGGLGAGALPEIGRNAMIESGDEIREILQGAHMVFITSGMGGGTGTGAAPAIAEMAKEMGILTVAVVTKPFDFEGRTRQKVAENGIAELEKFVDTLIIVPNQNLFRIVNERTSFVDAFKMADDVLRTGVECITTLAVVPGLVNVDFADIKTIMKNMGCAMMSSGESSGEDRAIKAAEMAVINPLLDISSIDGARGVLINITGGTDMTLFEVNDAVEKIRGNLEESANIIFGAIFNEKYDGSIKVSVVATGVQNDAKISNNIKEAIQKQSAKIEAKQEEPSKKVAISTVQSQSDLLEYTDEIQDEEEDEIENEADENADFVHEAKSDDADIEDIVNDDYVFQKIAEPSRQAMMQKAYKENNIESLKHKMAKEPSNQDKVEAKVKKSIGGVIGNIIFGAQDDVKKKVNNPHIQAVDLFEDSILTHTEVERRRVA